MIDAIPNNLACPACSYHNERGNPGPVTLAVNGDRIPGLSCGRCGSVYPVREGIIDFVGIEAADKKNLSQRAMEFRPLIALYERFWRPLVTRPFSSLTWEMDTSLRLLDLKPGLDVLDIACGPGNFTRRIASTLGEGAVAGIDLSWPMLKKAARIPAPAGSPAITFLRVDVAKWIFVPDSIDRVHCAGALHLFPDLRNVFNSIARSLRPGGIFVGATYLWSGGAMKKKFQDFIAHRSGFHWFEPDELRELAAQAGLTGWEQHNLKQGIVFRAIKP